jgi:metallothiol transferase
MSIKGINHLLFSVSDLEQSVKFYSEVFGAKLLVKGRTTAYFDLNGLWLALNEEKEIPRNEIRDSYTHIAFTVEEGDFLYYYEKLKELNVNILTGRPRHKKDKRSVYFTDADGHKFEFHTGTLKDRLDYYKHEKKHMEFFRDMDSHQAEVRLEEVATDNRKSFTDFLLLADENEEVINQYIYEGDMYSIMLNGDTAGVVLFVFDPGDTVEIKNIAIAPEFRGKGTGKKVIEAGCRLYKEMGFQRMIVGTANSSISNLAFYQKAGFRMAEIRQGYFNKYPEPVYEDGIKAEHMVVFERVL